MLESSALSILRDEAPINKAHSRRGTSLYAFIALNDNKEGGVNTRVTYDVTVLGSRRDSGMQASIGAWSTDCQLQTYNRTCSTTIMVPMTQHTEGLESLTRTGADLPRQCFDRAYV